jgi:hypothetical protein
MDHEARRDFHLKFEEALSFVCRLHAGRMKQSGTGSKKGSGVFLHAASYKAT